MRKTSKAAITIVKTLKMISQSSVLKGNNISYRFGGRNSLSAGEKLGEIPEFTFSVICKSDQIGEVTIHRKNLDVLESYLNRYTTRFST